MPVPAANQAALSALGPSEPSRGTPEPRACRRYPASTTSTGNIASVGSCLRLLCPSRNFIIGQRPSCGIRCLSKFGHSNNLRWICARPGLVSVSGLTMRALVTLIQSAHDRYEGVAAGTAIPPLVQVVHLSPVVIGGAFHRGVLECREEKRRSLTNTLRWLIGSRGAVFPNTGMSEIPTGKDSTILLWPDLRRRTALYCWFYQCAMVCQDCLPDRLFVIASLSELYCSLVAELEVRFYTDERKYWRRLPAFTPLWESSNPSCIPNDLSLRQH